MKTPKTASQLEVPTAAKLDRARRAAYLSSKGIKPNEPHQLDLLFPKTIGERTGLRHIPNDYARSSIFTARNKREPRRSYVREKLFHYNEHVTIHYTGPELRAEDDELVWLQILSYGQSCAFGEPFDFSVKDLVAAVGWHKNGRYYDKARECISRLKANEVLALNSKAYGTSGAISLIQNYTAVNDEHGKPTHYRVWIAKELVNLFAGDTFTSHAWMTYRDLSPVARRLADWIGSHEHPFPLTLKKFREICGSSASSTGNWRRTVKRACDEVREAKVANVIFLADDDYIRCIRD